MGPPKGTNLLLYALIHLWTCQKSSKKIMVWTWAWKFKYWSFMKSAYTSTCHPHARIDLPIITKVSFSTRPLPIKFIVRMLGWKFEVLRKRVQDVHVRFGLPMSSQYLICRLTMVLKFQLIRVNFYVWRQDSNSKQQNFIMNNLHFHVTSKH